MKELLTWARIKGAIRSATVWFNGLIVASIPLYEACKDDVEKLKPFLTDFNYQKVVLVVAGLNILLRFKTRQDLADK